MGSDTVDFADLWRAAARSGEIALGVQTGGAKDGQLELNREGGGLFSLGPDDDVVVLATMREGGEVP